MLLGVPLPQERCKPGGLGTLPRGSTKVRIQSPLIPVLLGESSVEGAGQQVQVGVRVTVLCASPFSFSSSKLSLF